jgi:thiol-disulfide isomerase/thioredoxin
MKKQKLLLILVLFLAAMVSAGLLYNALKDDVAADRLTTLPNFDVQPPDQSQPATDETQKDTHDQPQDFSAPDFTVVDLSGREHKLSEFVGKPIVLNFWASWCGPCRSEMPDFQKAYETYGDRIHFVMVNLTDGSSETVKTATDFIASAGYTFPVYYDTLSDAAMTYGVNAVPVTYFIDSSGQLIAYGQGALDAATLQSGIDMILPE